MRGKVVIIRKLFLIVSGEVVIINYVHHIHYKRIMTRGKGRTKISTTPFSSKKEGGTEVVLRSDLVQRVPQ
nr:hypothetical protein Iba_chr04aCG14120 [Ipomoea batatas]